MCWRAFLHFVTPRNPLNNEASKRRIGWQCLWHANRFSRQARSVKRKVLLMLQKQKKKNCAVTVVHHPAAEQWKWNGTVIRLLFPPGVGTVLTHFRQSVEQGCDSYKFVFCSTRMNPIWIFGNNTENNLSTNVWIFKKEEVDNSIKLMFDLNLTWLKCFCLTLKEIMQYNDLYHMQNVVKKIDSFNNSLIILFNLPALA